MVTALLQRYRQYQFDGGAASKRRDTNRIALVARLSPGCFRRASQFLALVGPARDA